MPNNTVIGYTYDAQGRLIAKRVNGVIEYRLIYSGQLAPVAKVDSEGNVLELYISGTGANSPDYIVKAGSVYRVIKDHLGSTRMIVNANTGDIVKDIHYSEFGEITEETGTFDTIFGFAGGIRDTDTNLTKFGARWYDPETGRWISKEPLGFEGSNNFYSYVNGDPVNKIDPSGLKTIVMIKHSDLAGHVIIWVENTGKYEYSIDGQKTNSAALYDPMGSYSGDLSDIAIGKAASISKYIKYFKERNPDNSYELFEYNTSEEEEKTLINAMISEGPGVPFSSHYCSRASYNVLMNLDRFYTLKARLAKVLIPLKSYHPYRLSTFLYFSGFDSYKTVTPQTNYSE